MICTPSQFLFMSVTSASSHSTPNMDQSAPYKIAELLKHQDDLDKISEIKQKLLREKATIDGQLKTGVQQQIQVLSHGTQSLADAKLRINQVRDDMMKVQKLKIESQESVENFDKINSLSRVLQNFEDTTKFLNNFRGMSAELADVQKLIEEDGGDEFSFDNSYPNLLILHYKLNRLRDVRDDAIFHSRNSTDDVKRTIMKHFSQLDKVVEQFDRLLFEIGENLLEILRSGDSSVIVRVAKIIDFEEKQDLVAGISNEISNKSSLLFKNKISNRIQREYPSRFFDSIEKSISVIFDNCMEAYPPDEDPDLLLENLGWIFNDLQLSKSYLVKCFPERWKILDKFVNYYQKQTHRLINKIMESEPTAATILHILDFVKDYYDTMRVEIGYKKEYLNPLLLDGKEDALYDDYLNLLISKLNEWYNNFSKTEKEPFILRQIPPETTPENTFGMQGEGIMFKLITQQIDVAANSGQGRILTGCIEECANILRNRQKDWERIMKQEVQKELNDQVDENGESNIAPGLFDYLIALANDQIKGADFTEAISSRRTQELSKKYSSKVKNLLDDVCDGFIEGAKSCINGMIQLIFNDLAPPFSKIFDDSSWYKAKPTRQIVDTINEYTHDCKSYQTPLVFEVFIEDLIAETLLHYLYALNNCRQVLKVPKGVDRIKLDIEMLYGVFSDPQFEISEELIQDHFKVFEHLLATIESPVSELPLRFQEFRHDFWDAPLDLFEKMVCIRKDIDVKLGKEIMIKVRNETLQSQQSNEGRQPTYLSKYQSKR